MEGSFESLERLLGRLSDEPVLQGIVAALCTFVLEDPTTVGCGLLVADGRMAFGTALAGLSVGIAVGDFGLYMLGRFVGGFLLRRRILKEERLAGMKAWFDRNLVAAIFASRFVPGMRFPTYTGAGLLRASFRVFACVVIPASFLWTVILLKLTSELGERAIPLMGRWKWPFAVGMIVAVAGLQYWIGRRRAARGSEIGTMGADRETRVVSPFEFWPMWRFYPPVALHYAWLAIRFRSLTLPTAANPTIFCGGFVRESKSQILGLVPDSTRGWISPWTTLERRSDSTLDGEVERALEAMREAGLGLPIVAKPDVGQRGAGVRLVETESDLRDYVAAFPVGERIIFQRLVPFEHEAGVFYVRRPDEERGSIFSLTLKYFPFVVGDGARTLRELILADERARIIPDVYFRRHEARLDERIPAGEKVRLVFAGNHAQGAIFKDGRDKVTPELVARFDEIGRSIPGFHFGRFDVRFRSLEAFQRGEDFQIVEINGAGAEATHIWDARTTLGEAYATLFRQFRILFEIGEANRRLGHRPVGPRALLRAIREGNEIVRRVPPSS